MGLIIGCKRLVKSASSSSHQIQQPRQTKRDSVMDFQRQLPGRPQSRQSGPLRLQRPCLVGGVLARQRHPLANDEVFSVGAHRNSVLWGHMVQAARPDERTIIRAKHSSTDTGVRRIDKFDISPPPDFHRHAMATPRTKMYRVAAIHGPKEAALGYQPGGEVAAAHQNGPLKAHHHHPGPRGVTNAPEGPRQHDADGIKVCHNAAQSNIQRPSLVISNLVASGVFSLMKIPISGSYIVAKIKPHRLMYTIPIFRVTRTLDWASSGLPSPMRRPTIDVIATEKPTAGMNERCMYRMAIHEAVVIRSKSAHQSGHEPSPTHEFASPRDGGGPTTVKQLKARGRVPPSCGNQIKMRFGFGHKKSGYWDDGFDDGSNHSPPCGPSDTKLWCRRNTWDSQGGHTNFTKNQSV